jgi:hypothetical protein
MRTPPEDAFHLERYILSSQLETILMLPAEARILSADSYGADPCVWVWQPVIARNTLPRPVRFFVIGSRTVFVPPANARLLGTISWQDAHIFADEDATDDET